MDANSVSGLNIQYYWNAWHKTGFLCSAVEGKCGSWKGSRTVTSQVYQNTHVHFKDLAVSLRAAGSQQSHAHTATLPCGAHTHDISTLPRKKGKLERCNSITTKFYFISEEQCYGCGRLERKPTDTVRTCTFILFFKDRVPRCFC